MKLILAFSEVNNEYNAEDIIIHGHPLNLIVNGQTIDIHSISPDEKHLSNYYDDFLKNIKEEFPDTMKDIIIGSHNNLYTNHLSLFKWISLIDKIISEHEVDEIIISDLIKSKSYAPYYEAEGEAHTRLLYKPYDFIPQVIYGYIIRKYKIVPRVLRYRSQLLLAGRKLLRRYVLLFIKFCFYSIKVAQLKNKSKKEVRLKDGDVQSVIVSRSIAHFDAVERLHNTLPSSILFCGESGFTFGANYNFSKSNSKNVLSFANYLSWGDILYSLFFVLNSIFRTPKNICIDIAGVSYSYSDAVIEMCIAYFEVSILERSINNFLITQNLSKKCVLYTCEMYTPFTKSISKIGKNFTMPTVQLQTTNMFVIYEPNYIHCDYFIFNSKALANSYNQKYPDKKSSTPFLGNFSVNSPKKTVCCLSKPIKKVLYFTQPLTDENLEQDIIEELIRLGKQDGFLVQIKLHPRDNSSKLSRFLNDIDIIDKSLTFDVYMEGVDLAVLKTSSIATKIVLKGVPILYCLYSDWARNGKLDYIDFLYKGTTVQLADIQTCISDLPALKESFINYRQRYIVENGLDSGVEDFVKNMQEII